MLAVEEIGFIQSRFFPGFAWAFVCAILNKSSCAQSAEALAKLFRASVLARFDLQRFVTSGKKKGWSPPQASPARRTNSLSQNGYGVFENSASATVAPRTVFLCSSRPIRKAGLFHRFRHALARGILGARRCVLHVARARQLARPGRELEADSVRIEKIDRAHEGRRRDLEARTHR